MSLVEGWNEFVARVGRAWDSAGPFQTIIVLLIPAVAWFGRKPLADIVLRLLKGIAKWVGITISDRVEEHLLPAIQVLIVALGAFVAHEHVRLPDPYYGIVEKLIVSICVAAVFKVIHSLCNLIPQLYETRRALRTLDQTTLVVRVAQVISAFVGVAAVLKVWGIDVGPVLTGMGVAGAAVALASQDYLKNLLAGFNNATERRFREGDWIQVDGLVEGIVESIDLRSTLLRRFDLAPVHVANADLASGALINFGRRPHRKIYWKISLKYNLSVKTLRAIRERVERYIDGSDYFESPDVASRFVRIDSFSESSIDMLVYCFTHSPAYGDYLEAKEDLALAIKSIVEEKGGAFAYPSRSIYIEESAWAGPDRFKGSEPEDKRVDRKMD